MDDMQDVEVFRSVVDAAARTALDVGRMLVARGLQSTAETITETIGRSLLEELWTTNVPARHQWLAALLPAVKRNLAAPKIPE